MSTKETFDQLLTNGQVLALATETAAGHTPSVRFVNFMHFTDQPNTIYFGTAADAQKVQELTANPTVSFATLPDHFQVVRVTGAKVTEAPDRDAFVTAMNAKYESFKNFPDAYKASMKIYAATFDQALVGDDTLTF